MKKQDLKFVLDILQNKPEGVENRDWYSIMGFLELHKITGSFYHAAKRLDIKFPQQIERKLKNTVYVMTKRNEIMREWAYGVSNTLREAEVLHAFLKGSVLNDAGIDSKFIYEKGARVSNDIDILMPADQLTRADKVLKSLGFVQGYWDFEKDGIVILSRQEIISRRMNRGETAPYLQKTDNPVLPFIEIDINFSLSYLPNGNEDLLEAMMSSVDYSSGKLSSLSATHFFIHLLMHQYKEMTVYSMVKRNKDTELYKYLDIYKFLSLKLIDKREFYETVNKFGIERECLAVVRNTELIFDTLKAEKLPDESAIIDPENNGKKYKWALPLRERLLNFDNVRYLYEV